MGSAVFAKAETLHKPALCFVASSPQDTSPPLPVFLSLFLATLPVFTSEPKATETLIHLHTQRKPVTYQEPHHINEAFCGKFKADVTVLKSRTTR